MQNKKVNVIFPRNLILTAALVSAVSGSALAQPNPKAPPPPPAEPQQTQGAGSEKGETVEVEALKKKYWAVGDENRLGVVQDRYYTKRGKFELAGFGGFYSGDPFLDTRSLGGLLAYHFTESLSLKALAWKDLVSDSKATQKFVERAGVRTNSNPTQGFYGAEAALSPLYGKLSLFGEMILYFDLHVAAGLGATSTENGNYVTGLLGIGQQVFVARNAAIGIDFRWLAYKEDIVEKVDPATRGQVLSSDMAYSSLVSVGFHLYL